MLKDLLRDSRVGKSAPVTIALVLRLLRLLLERRTLDSTVRAGLRVAEVGAFEAFAAAVGEAAEGSGSAKETRERLTSLWDLTGYPYEIEAEDDSVAHAPLSPSKYGLVNEKRTLQQLGDALHHLRWKARRETLTLTKRVLQGIVIDRLATVAQEFTKPGIDQEATLRSVAESLAPDLGCLPDTVLVRRCIEGLADIRDPRWEPLAELFSLWGVAVNPETLRKSYRRYSDDIAD